MTRHGTMPEMIYQRQLQTSANKVDLAASEGSVVENEEEVEAIERNPENDVEVAEYDSSTDEDEDLEERDRLSSSRRSHNTFWTTSQDQQQISNVEVVLLVYR